MIKGLKKIAICLLITPGILYAGVLQSKLVPINDNKGNTAQSAVVEKSEEVLDKVVAIVNNEVITATELDKETEMLRRQILARNQQLPPDDVLKKQVLQHLIDINLQLQLAKNNNFSIDDSELDAAIQKIAENNRITVDRLRMEIEKFNIGWDNYRENFRKEMLISQIQQKAVSQDVVISTQQVEDYLKTARNSFKYQQDYHLQNIVVPLSDEPSTEEIKHALKKANDLLNKLENGADFEGLAIAESSGEFALEGGDLGERKLSELPEIFAEKVVNMKKGEYIGPIRTGNGFHIIKLVNVSNENARHEVVKTHVRHILVKPDSNLTNEEALRQINNIYQQLKSGKDFTEMAKLYSMDAASAVYGGDLGWVTGQELVPEFAQAMDVLTLNTVSKPIQSKFGWHIIEVLERKTEDDSQAYEQLQVRQLLFERKFKEAVALWQQHLRTEAFINILEKELA